MADNQMVQVDFQFNLGNVPESAKAFTKYLETMGVNLKFTKASTDALASSLDHLAVSQSKATAAGEVASSSLKKTNQQWTNLALVIQDLPYGFRGIQNNLPALVGGFAGMTGGLYFAASAVIAFFTAWDNGMISFGNSTKLAKEYTKNLAEGFAAETVKLDSLYRVATDVSGAMNERILAAKTLKEIYPGLLSLYSEEDILLGNAKDAYDELTSTLWQYAQAKAAEKSLEDLAKKQNELTIERTKLLQVQAYRQLKVYQKTKALTLDQMTFMKRLESLVMSMGGDQLLLNDVQALGQVSEALYKNSEASKALNGEALDYKNILDDNVNAAEKLAIAQGKDPESKAAAAAKAKALADKKAADKKYAADKKAALEEVNKSEVEAYLSTLSLQDKEEYAVNKKFIDLEAKAKQYGISTIGLEEARLKEINSIKEKYDLKEKERSEKSIKSNSEWESKIAVDSTKAMLDIREAKAKEEKKILDREFQNEMDAIQNRLDAQLKGHKKEPIKQQQDYNEAIAGYILMAMQAGKTAEEIDKLQDKINKVKSSAEGTASAFTPLADVLNNLTSNTLVEFGTQLGNMLSGGEFSLNGFLTLLADAIIEIGKHLLIVSGLFAAVDALFKAPGMWPIAIGVGIAAIAAGTALKNSAAQKNPVTKFANGGIISGPTMGLVGEYPGAKSNPEVVAPLDKLKSMIGGGGNGEFVLRGSDLVLALQRSNYSLNLRRGS